MLGQDYRFSGKSSYMALLIFAGSTFYNIGLDSAFLEGITSDKCLQLAVEKLKESW